MARFTLIRSCLRRCGQYIEKNERRLFNPTRSVFHDLDIDEVISNYCGGRKFRDRARSFFWRPKISDRYAVRAGDSLPDSVDWRTKGVLVGILKQGKCGSCWAMAAICTIEALHRMVTGKLIPLSVQELVDCDRGSFRCDGGFVSSALYYVIKRGISTEEDYPYSGKAGKCWKRKKAAKVFPITSYEAVPPYDENALKKAVSYQPIAVTIDADSKKFLQYKKGILREADVPGPYTLNHSVVVVGYGRENGMNYWLIRNSYGVAWGYRGYGKIQRDISSPGGMLGIARLPFYPVASPNPSR